MAHYNKSVKEQVIALIEHAGLSVPEAGARLGVHRATAFRWWKKYEETGNVERKRGTGRQCVSSQDQDQRLIDQCRQQPFMCARQLKESTAFPGDVTTVRRRLRAAGLRSFRAAVKERLTEEHKVDRLAFAEVNIDRQWDSVVFTDEKIFSTGNVGPTRVYRPSGRRFDPQYVARSSRMGHVAIHCWGWICKAAGGGGIHRITGRLNGQKYVELLDFMLPEIKAHVDDGKLQLQQDHSSVHDSLVVQSWLQRQPDLELVEWVPRGADLNPIEHVWAAVVRILRERWSDNPPRTVDDLWEQVEDAWGICCTPRFISRLVDSVPRRLEAVREVNGDYTRY